MRAGGEVFALAPTGHDLDLLLGQSLGEAIEKRTVDPATRCALVPVPIHSAAALPRIDHTLGPNRGVAAATDLPIHRALARSHRPTQHRLRPGSGPAKVAGAIRPRRGVDLEGRCDPRRWKSPRREPSIRRPGEALRRP